MNTAQTERERFRNIIRNARVRDLRVTQVQLDELFALLSAVKDGEVSEAEAIERLEQSPQWVWVAMDPLWKAFHNGSYRRSIVMEG